MRRARSLVALSVVAVALAAAVWWSTNDASEGEQSRPRAAVHPDEEAAQLVPHVGALQAEAGSVESGRASIEAATEVEAESTDPVVTASATPTAVLVGRVVDEQSRPMADVVVRALASKIWTEGIDVPRLDGPYDVRGFELRTDALGAFRIEVPVPTAPIVAVQALPDRFHDSWITRLGKETSCDGPPLAAGLRDLGEIRLARAGAIRGRVTDESGAPLAGVRLTTGSEPGRTFSRDGETAPDGMYLIEHAVVGTYGVAARLDGYLQQFQTPVTVEAGRDTEGVDFALLRAPSIEGIVADEHGRPVEGARLWGWPSSSGSGAGAKSGADGRFVVYLPQDEPYRFSVERDGYVTWDEEGGHETTFDPGARDVRIVLRSLPRTRFLVVDAESSQPIERFGLNILENNGSRAKGRTSTEKRPPLRADHAGGVVEATARPGIDQYIVAADGYIVQYADVEHAAEDDPSQTIRMKRCGVVRGRVLRDGQPVRSAAVTLFGTRRSGDRGADGQTKWTVRVERNERSSTETDAEGRFTLDAPTSGDLRLVIEPDEGAPSIVDGIDVRSGKERDLGDLELLEGAIVEGRVLPPAGVDAAGLTVFLGDWRDDVKSVTDSQGGFRFEELAAGEQTVWLDDRPGLVASGASAPVSLRPGEVTRVTLDARDRGVCAVTIELDLGGLPMLGVAVELIRASGANAGERDLLGECDAGGRVSGFVCAWGEARVAVRLPGFRSPLDHPDARFDLVPGGELDEKLRFPLGTLRVLPPPGTTLPEDGTLRLVLQRPGAADEESTISVPMLRGAPHQAGGLASATSGGVEIRAVPAGSWSVRVELEESAAPLERVPVGRGFRMSRTPYSSGSASVELADGETVEVQLD